MPGYSFGDPVVFWGVAGATLEYQCCFGELVPWWGANALQRCSFGEPVQFWGAGAMAGDQ